MSKSNASVHGAFNKGQEAHNGRYTLESVPFPTGLAGSAMALRSYRTDIAIRRNRDGAIFHDGHRYSVTTSQHQSGYGPKFSFDCVAEIMGRDWWERATIQDWGPRDCNDPACEKELDDLRALYDAGLTKDYLYRECFAPNSGGQHSVAIDGYEGWYGTAVLLSFSRDGRNQVLCGYERGKRIRFGGRTDQLWAAQLPRYADDVLVAFEVLKPAAAQQRTYRDIESRADEAKRLATKRQGDLYFVPCTNGDGPEATAITLNGAPLPPSEDRANHRASQVRVAFDAYTGNRGPADGWRIWARGQVLHPEHPRLCLGQVWHRVYRSAAVRAASSAYQHPMGGQGNIYGD